MGVNVLSGLPGALATAVAQVGNATAATSTDGVTGNFAALLSGELQSLLGSTGAASGKSLLVDTTDSGKPGLIDEEAATDTPLDPALIAALSGNPAIQPAIVTNAGTVRPPALSELNGKSLISGDEPATSLLDEQLEAGKATTVRDTGLATAFSNALEKASSSATAQAPGGLVRNEAANIAAETNAATPPAGWVNGTEAMAAGRQVQDSAQTRQTSVSPHIQTPAWPQHFGEKVVWLAKNDQQSAQININPPQLGPVQITINLSGDQASLAFASPHAEVRQAIESAMPQLKDMLSAAGINLGQSNVGANLSQNTPENPFQSANGTRFTGENAILPGNEKEATAGAGHVLQRGRGLVDLFA